MFYLIFIAFGTFSTTLWVHCLPIEDVTEPVTIRLTPEHFHPIESLYHSQDKTGHYIYGYATPTASFKETHTSDGATHGGYSYIDVNGKLQTVEYTADPLHGFRVAASNLPVESDDVTNARVVHLQAVQATKEKLLAAAKLHQVAYSNPVAVQQVQNPVKDLPEVEKARQKHLAILQSAYAGHINALHTLPQPVQEPPEIVKARQEHLAKFNAIKSSHEALKAEIAALSPELSNGDHVIPVHIGNKGATASDEAQLSYAPVQYGTYSYGYVDPFVTKSETQSADGIVTGGYSYIDAAGVVQTVKYTADKDGFRVAATNIPVDNRQSALQSALKNSATTEKQIVIESNLKDDKKAVVPAIYSTNIFY